MANVKEKVKSTAKKAADKAAAETIEAKKTVRKAAKGTKAAADKAVKTAAKAPAKKAAAARLKINIQSPLGGVITPEEISAKVPKDATEVYVRVDENRIYWVSKTGTGSVDIW